MGQPPRGPAAQLAAPAGDTPPQPEEAPIKNITRTQGLVTAGAAALFFEEGWWGHPARNRERKWRECHLAHCLACPGGNKTSLPCTRCACFLPLWHLYHPSAIRSPTSKTKAINSMDLTGMSRGRGPCPPSSLMPSTEPAHSQRPINTH